MIQSIHFKIEHITISHVFTTREFLSHCLVFKVIRWWCYWDSTQYLEFSSDICNVSPHGGLRSVICIVWEYRGYIDFYLLSKFLYLSDIRKFDCSVSQQKEIWISILSYEAPEVRRGERRDGGRHSHDDAGRGGGGAQPGQPGGVEPQWALQRSQHINLPDRGQYLYQEGNVSSYLGLHIIIIIHTAIL